MSLESANFLVGIGTLLLQIATIGLFVVYFLSKKNHSLRNFVHYVAANSLWLAFMVNLAALVGSLYYSEILGLAPCSLCWIQRIFQYPQVVLFAIASWKKDTNITIYSIWLSILGAIVSLYQHYLQTGGEQLIPCPASSAAGVDCAKRFLFEFGYITFPLVAFSVFAFLIVLMLYVRKAKR
jgi:disulfide bond formation protein DsbB